MLCSLPVDLSRVVAVASKWACGVGNVRVGTERDPCKCPNKLPVWTGHHVCLLVLGGAAAVSRKVSVGHEQHEQHGHWGSVSKAKSSEHCVNEHFLGNGDCPSRAITLD